uniref:B-cell translocation gene 4 n=1 Tax=Fundulus heteroclitus TaxID=8078 RepID=A0A3Q2QD60_FUNHE
MKEEIAAAVFFTTRLVKKYGCLHNDSRERFAAALTSVLFENYKNHWHPNAPTKGQAYRSVICDDTVGPGETELKYGEHSTPFCVSLLDSRRDGEFSRRINDAVERASLDVQSGSSSDEEDGPKTIPTVSNPNRETQNGVLYVHSSIFLHPDLLLDHMKRAMFLRRYGKEKAVPGQGSPGVVFFIFIFLLFECWILTQNVTRRFKNCTI